MKQLAENAGAEGYRDKFERTLEVEGTEELLTVLGRGERTMAGDIPGSLDIHARVHPPHGLSFYPRPGLPQRLGAVPRSFGVMP